MASSTTATTTLSLGSSTPLPAQLKKSNARSDGLSAGFYVAVGVVCLMIVMVAAGLLFCFFWCRKSRRKRFDHLDLDSPHMTQERDIAPSRNFIPSVLTLPPAISAQAPGNATILSQENVGDMGSIGPNVSVREPSDTNPRSDFNNHAESKTFEETSSATDEPGTERGSGSSDLSASGCASVSSGLTTALEEQKQRAINTIMNELKSLLIHSPMIGLSIRAGGRDRPTQSEATSSRTSRETNCSSKRSREQNEQENDIGIEAGSSEAKKAKRSPQVDGSVPPKLACPFFRRNPQNHLKHRSCAGPGWASVHRIKEHIYRCHTLPIHCPRCGAVFSSNFQLTGHQRQQEGCSLQLVRLPEGINKEKEALLRKKKKHVTEEEKWRDMYRTLFPDEDGDLTPSPYYDDIQDELNKYETFHRRELLRVVRKMLEETVTEMAGPLEDQLRRRFVDILRAAQSEVHLSYRSGNRNIETMTEDRSDADAEPGETATSTTRVLPSLGPSRAVLEETSILERPSSAGQDLATICRDGTHNDVILESPSAECDGSAGSRRNNTCEPMSGEWDYTQQLDLAHGGSFENGNLTNGAFVSELDLDRWFNTSELD